jgi:hypothetical protein
MERHRRDGSGYPVVKVGRDPAPFSLLRRDRLGDQPVTVVSVSIDGVAQAHHLQAQTEQVGARLQARELRVRVRVVDTAVHADHSEDLPTQTPGRHAQTCHRTAMVQTQHVAVDGAPRPVRAEPHAMTVPGHQPRHPLADQHDKGRLCGRIGGIQPTDGELRSVGQLDHSAGRPGLLSEGLSQRTEVEGDRGGEHLPQLRLHWNNPSRNASAIAPPRSWTSSLR